MRPFGFDCGAYTSASLPVFFKPLCQLRSMLCQPLFRKCTPAGLTNLEIMLVRQRVVNLVYSGYSSQNLVAHLIHRVLDTGTFIFGKRRKSDIPSGDPSFIKFRACIFDIFDRTEGVPSPSTGHFSAQDSVVRFWQTCIFVSDKMMKGGTSALQDQKPGDGRADTDPLSFCRYCFDVSCFCSVSQERMRMWLTIYCHPRPSVADNPDLSRMDMLVGLDEMGSHYGAEKFRRCDRVFLCHDVDCVFHGICRDHYAVIGLSITTLYQRYSGSEVLINVRCFNLAL